MGIRVKIGDGAIKTSRIKFYKHKSQGGPLLRWMAALLKSIYFWNFRFSVQWNEKSCSWHNLNFFQKSFFFFEIKSCLQHFKILTVVPTVSGLWLQLRRLWSVLRVSPPPPKGWEPQPGAPPRPPQEGAGWSMTAAQTGTLAHLLSVKSNYLKQHDYQILRHYVIYNRICIFRNLWSVLWMLLKYKLYWVLNKNTELNRVTTVGVEVQRRV